MRPLPTKQGVTTRKPSRGAGKTRKAAVVTENSVRSENTGFPIIREIMVATTMSSLFVAFFALLAFTFRTLCLANCNFASHRA